MRFFFFRLAVLSVFASACPLHAQIKTGEVFLEAVKTANQEKSPQKINVITYTEGMSEEDKQLVENVQKTMLASAREVESISFLPLPPNFESTYIQRGKKWEATHAPLGLVQIQYKGNGSGIHASSTPYAIIDGGYYLVGMKSTDLGWKGPPDHALTFMVMGTGMEKISTQVKWNASGVDLEQTFATPNSSFMGQYFSEITVTSTQPDTDVTLTIREANKEIYRSEPLKGVGTLKYRKKN